MQIRQKYVYGDGRRLDGQRFAESQLARATGVNQSNLVKFFHFEIPFPDSLSLSRFAITRLLQVSGTCIKSNENLTRKIKLGPVEDNPRITFFDRYPPRLN